MSTEIKCSVAIATYNGGQHIGAQLESIFSQSTKPHEIVISDDGSTDDTLDIAESLLRKSEIDYKIVKNKYDRGYTTNFSTALEATTGELVFICDQDDIWLPKKIEVVKSIFSAKEVEMVVHDARIFWDRTTQDGPLISEVLLSHGISPKDNIYGCMMAVRRSILDIALPMNTNALGHDTLLSLLATSRGSRLYCDQTLIRYRRHDHNASKKLLSELEKTGKTGKTGKTAIAFKRLFDYEWLEKRRSELSVFHAMLMRSRRDGATPIPLSALHKLENDLRALNLRYDSIFHSGFPSVLCRLPSYLKSGITAKAWAKDVLASTFKLHHQFLK